MLAALASLSLQEHTQQGACRPCGSSAQDRPAALRRAFRAASLQWHPDKFLARHEGRLSAQDRPAVVQRLQGICQAINEEWKHTRLIAQ